MPVWNSRCTRSGSLSHPGLAICEKMTATNFIPTQCCASARRPTLGLPGACGGAHAAPTRNQDAGCRGATLICRAPESSAGGVQRNSRAGLRCGHMQANRSSFYSVTPARSGTGRHFQPRPHHGGISTGVYTMQERLPVIALYPVASPLVQNGYRCHAGYRDECLALVELGHRSGLCEYRGSITPAIA